MREVRLTTTDADEVLTATAEALECRLLSSRLVQEHISGDGLISAYETVLEPVDAQQQTQLIYLETAPSVSDRDGVLVFQNSEGDEIAVWLYPRDPALPTLPKVVRPSHTAELHTQYQLWGSAGLPVPATLGWSDEGLIAFSALSGVPAHERVAQLGDAFLSSLTGLIYWSRRFLTRPTGELMHRTTSDSLPAGVCDSSERMLTLPAVPMRSRQHTSSLTGLGASLIPRRCSTLQQHCSRNGAPQHENPLISPSHSSHSVSRCLMHTPEKPGYVQE